MSSKSKLELTWVGKDERPRLEPRILIGDLSLSHHAARRVCENDSFDNKLILAAKWCERAGALEVGNGGKPWRYLLISHDHISSAATLSGFASRFTVTA